MKEMNHARKGLILEEPLIFELEGEENSGVSLMESDVEAADVEAIPDYLLRSNIDDFPQLTEPEVVRHFVRLSTRNYSIDTGMYPLGSCTMKYNPKLNDAAASLEGFSQSHPFQDEKDAQGILKLFWELERDLAEISGMDYVSLHPAAGAHGELLGIMLIRAYHDSRQDFKRTKILIPDSAHGTNPSTAALCGYDVVKLPSAENGLIDLDKIDQLMTDEIAGIMITNPNTCGLFERDILKITELIHQRGGLVYLDGANMNAVMGIARPGDMGADVMHFNVHKTFSTPHGGGGPGAGPIGIKAKLEPFLPKPVLSKKDDFISLNYDRPQSIGKIRSFYGNTGVLIRAYTYIKTMGNTGLKTASQTAVLNANYIKKKLEDYFNVPFSDQHCMHEVLLDDAKQKDKNLTTLELAKGLIESGFHPPTVYFPLIVHGAMLIEPTETESKRELDNFIEAMIELSKQEKEYFKNLPQKAYVTKVDETLAARKPNVRWRKKE